MKSNRVAADVRRLISLAALCPLIAFAQGRTQINRAYLQTDLDANGNAVTNLAAPVLPGDAARKGYVDTAATNASRGAGNGLVLVGTNLHFAQSSSYTVGRIPFASSATAISYDSGLLWDSTNNILQVIAAAGENARIRVTSNNAINLEISAGGDILMQNLTAHAGNFDAPTVISDIGGVGSASAILDLSSIDKGLLMPRMTTTQRNAISSPATGLLVVNSTTSSIDMYNGASWVALVSGSVGTVTSVGLSLPSWLSVSGSPVTTSGTLAVAAASGQTANRFLATPDGSSGSVGLRAISTNDLPGLTKDLGAISGGSAGDVYYYDGTNLRNLGAGTNGQVLTITAGVPSWKTPEGGDVFNIVTNNSQTINYHVAKGGNLTLTNSLLFAFSTLTLSGTNVSTLSLTNSTMFKLTLTTNGFLNAPLNFPGTNFGGSYQIHVAQDATGGWGLMGTNSGWLITGGGSSTNQIFGINTNANAISILTFVTSPFTATKVFAVTSPF